MSLNAAKMSIEKHERNSVKERVKTGGMGVGTEKSSIESVSIDFIFKETVV